MENEMIHLSSGIDSNNINNSIINESEIIELNRQLEESENRYKYLLADLQNTKKRYLKIIDDINKYREEEFFTALLEVLDDMTMLIDNDDSEVYKIIYYKLVNLLEKFQLVPISQDRSAYFNEATDEAVFVNNVDDPSLDNTVSQVVKRGYKYKDKIIRYEKVIVNKYKKPQI